MTNTFNAKRAQLFDREHLLVVVGALFISLHIVDELVRKEELAPPFIPLLIITTIYTFLPLFIRKLAILIIGIIFFTFQIPGHMIPILQRGPVGSDYTGIFPMIGGAILIYMSIDLLKKRIKK